MKTKLSFSPQKPRLTVKTRGAEQRERGATQIVLKKGLPAHFAQKMLKLEALCNEKRATPKQVQELIELYQDAVEYYESKNSEKYVLYKGRLQSVISNPALLQILSGGDKKSKTQEERPAEEEKRESRKELEQRHQKKVKQRSQQLHFYKEMKKEEEKKSSETHASELMQSSASKVELKLEALQSDLGSQDESFQRRLAERRKNRKKGHSISGAEHFGFLSYSKDGLESVAGLESIHDESTRGESGFGTSALSHQRNVSCSFLSDDLFGEDGEQSEVSVSSSVHARVQEEFQNEMKKIWAQTEAEIAKLNISRDKEVERILEQYAEKKIDKVAEIKVRYESEIAKCQKKVLPKKLKEKLMDKLEKEQESEIAKMTEELDAQKKQEIGDIKVVYEDKRRASMKGSRLERAMKRMKNLSRASGTYSVQNGKPSYHNRSATLDFSLPDAQSWTESLYGANSMQDALQNLSVEIESPAPKQRSAAGARNKSFKTYIVDEDEEL